jgi:hypothetical protein
MSDTLRGREYLLRLPDRVPDGRCLVHNHVTPTRRLGSRGFRAWLLEPGPTIERCECGWAPELEPHFRVVRVVVDDV